MMAIDAPGVYQLSGEAYHADPCPEPSLSASIIKKLLDGSPRHAWTAHPRLNPRYKAKQSDSFDLGKAAHACLLYDRAKFRLIDASSWQTKTAKAAKRKAHASGHIPLLTSQWRRVQEMVKAARSQLDEIPELLVEEALIEQTLVWQEDGIWCRARADITPKSLIDGVSLTDPVVDYKTTEASANPELAHQLGYRLGWDIIHAWYRRGFRHVFGLRDIEYRFFVQEVYEPFAACPIGIPPEHVAAADKQIDRALATWRRCLAENRWPGYPARTCWIERPVYQQYRWTGRELVHQIAKSQGDDLLSTAIEWQSPLEGAGE